MIEMEILDWLPIIVFTWTATAAIWLAALVVAAMLGSSGLSGRHKGVIIALSVGGSLALAWAGLADLGELSARSGSVVPELTPQFMSIWGLGLLGLLPLIFALLGGPFRANYHPGWAPFVYVSKGLSFLASVVTILAFYLQHLN